MSSHAVTTAVILAAGAGERIRDSEKGLPKPLVVLGGLYLLERSILNLDACGIKRFRVVLGYRGQEIERVIRSCKNLVSFKIEFLYNPDFEKGNGSSLAKGVEGLQEPFLLTMADHLFGPDTLRQFISKALLNGERAQLGTDKNIKGVFDLPDATKVLSEAGRIEKIGKELSDFNEIDTGLFYFPEWSPEKIQSSFAQGADSVSEIVAEIRKDHGFFTTSLDNAFWQDVDTPEMKKEAERRLFRSLIKPTDGPVSKKINRNFSLPVSKILIQLGISPNAVTTFVFLFTLGGAALATSTDYMWVAVAGLIFQIASILDGCDGEIARLTYQGTEAGAWYDTLTDNVRYGVFFCALGVHGYRVSGETYYLWAMALFALLLTYMVSMNVSYLRATRSKGTGLVVTAQVEKLMAERQSFWDRYILGARVLVKQDVSALIVFICCLANRPTWIFWGGFVGIAAMTFTVARALKAALPANSQGSPKIRSLFFLLIGVIIFAYLLKKIDATAVVEAISHLGSSVFVAFAVAPLWFFFNSLSLRTLLKNRVGIFDLLYNQVVGESFNVLIPMAGLGGEPYKTKHLTKWVGLEDATHAIINDKLLHILSGNVFTALLMFFVLAAVPMEGATKSALLLTTVAVSGISLFMILVTLSPLPTKYAGRLLKKFKMLDQARASHVPLGTYALSFLYKMLARAPQLLETYIIFKLLGVETSWVNMIAVTGLISASAMVFFFIPQGIGVNEGGVVKAFSLLGLSSPLGLTFGIIRRARVVFWAVAGILLYATVSLVQKGSATWRPSS